MRRDETEESEYEVPPAARLRVEKGEIVAAGEQLTEGAKNPQRRAAHRGPRGGPEYLLEEVQRVYRSQGVNINDKHIEIIMRQMLRKVQSAHVGRHRPSCRASWLTASRSRRSTSAVQEDGGRPATGYTVLLGVTKASLNTESFLAAASFQETTRVLTEAAVKGSRDNLRGLKENVIIGKLIPVGTGFEASQRRLINGGRKQLAPATGLDDGVED